MMKQDSLHILNGQSMYDYFKKTHFIEQEMLPFNEAMCYGNACSDIFSQEFVETRANVHHVTTEQYEEKILKPLQPLFSKSYSVIELWFDADMFCQINLLTILAWLDQTDYKCSISLHVVGDKFEPVEHFTLNAKGYDELYQQVFIQKTMPHRISPPLLKTGVELYLNYLNEDSPLMLYIQNHQHVPEKELVLALLNEFREYGLGNTQYMEMIKKDRRISE